jgi:sirohydrochlorin cobaltochelatase
MEAVAARLTARSTDIAVRCAYLELTEPDLPTTAAELAGLGLTSVRIVPMFLGAGRHVREDLPALVASLRERHPRIQWTLQAPVGEDERLLDLLADLAAGPVPPA